MIIVYVLISMVIVGGSGLGVLFFLSSLGSRKTPIQKRTAMRELDSWRQQAIEAATNTDALDDIDELYHVKLKKIGKVK